MSDSTPQDPTHDPQGPVIAVRLLADELLKIVKIAHELVEAGGAVELAGLDRRVGLLCAKSLDLPPDDGRRVRPRLIALSGSVEALSRALAARAPPSC